MSKYGMTKEEYDVWLEAEEVPSGWKLYSWEVTSFTSSGCFPSDKVAKAYFAAKNINDYYQETV